MNIARRIVAIAFVLTLVVSSPAFALSLPKSFKVTDEDFSDSFKAAVLAETATFYTTTGKSATLKRGDKLTINGMQNTHYAKATYNGVDGYIAVKNIIAAVGVSAHVRKDCWAYEYEGDQKVKLTFGKKVYVVGRFTDSKGTLWLLCTNKGGDALAYVKRSNLYR